MDETEFIGKIKLYDHIIVYGAGMVGSLVCKWLKMMSFHNRMTGFAVSKKGREQLYCGEPVFGIEELLPYRESALVIIATMPELQKEIADRLSEYRFQNAVPIDQMLYHGMEQRYMLEFASRHPVRQKKIDLLFMASDNNSSSGAFLCMADLCVELRKYGMSSLVILPEYGIAIYGAEIGEDYYQRIWLAQMDPDYLNGILGQAPEELFTVLLAHNPDYFPQYAAWGADLTLSGHVHGGVVRIPVWGKGVISPAWRLFPKYDGGIFREGAKTMVLSRGMGSHTIPVRIFNPAELWVIDFHSPQS